MALVLELIRSEIPLNQVFSWLLNGDCDEDLKELLKNEAEVIQLSFPNLIIAFIKEQASRIVKQHNIGPSDNSISTNSPKRENLVSSVNNLSILSPSPHFKNAVALQETRRIRKVTPQPLDLQSDSAFPSLQQSSQLKEVPKKRRINPTQLMDSPVANRSQSRFGSCVKPYSSSPGNAFNQAKEQASPKSLDQERALLKEKKLQLAIPIMPDLATNLPKSWPCIEPDPNLVTQRTELDRLSAIFAFCLSQNLVPTFYSEIQFLIQLLVIRVSPARLKSPVGNLLLDTVHNCVYFSAKTLEHLKCVWSYIDQSLVKQLADNQRLITFSPCWVNGELTRLASISVEHRNSTKTLANVAFQLDTDNRFNFASDASFQTFRKQRDQFCEVWQIWKVNSANPGWNMATSLQKMIQSLVDLRKDSVNYVHLARLFRSQLLNVAQLTKSVKDEEETDGPLGQLQSSDPDKLRRLRERLINPPMNRVVRYIGGDPMSFEGDQEFFRDFIILASSPAFNEHLKNSLVNGIEDLSRSEDCDDEVQFAETLIALQVMAKFLGFLHFYPHALVDHLPEHIFHDLARLRSSQTEAIRLMDHMEEAFRKGKVVLVVPWVVTYLIMADPVSLRLASFHPVLCYLIYTFRKAELVSANAFLVRILLSWLFDQTYFPRPLLSKTDDELQAELRRQSLTADQSPQLDQCPLVNSRLIHQCCPFLWSWKQLLTEFASSDAKSNSERTSIGRKITPVSAEENPSPVKTPTVKSLDQSLEENFFHNQPSSVKRTVEFVAERLASNIVREVRHQIIPRLVEEAQATLKTWMKVGDANQLEDLCRNLCADVRKGTLSAVESATSTLDATMVTLLPNDLLPPVRKVCVVVASKIIHGKVLDWINLHVTIGLFKNDLGAECAKLEKIQRKIAPQSTSTAVQPLPISHDSTTLAPSVLIDQLKTSIRQVIRDASKVTRLDVISLLEQSKGTLQRRIDVIPAVFKCLQQLTFDFVFILCVFQPECIEYDAIVAWVSFWSQTYSSIETEEPLAGSVSSSVWQVLTPKQLLLLAQSTSPRDSWSHVSTLLVHLMKSGLVSYKDLQEQAVAVVRQEWPQELLGRFATCVRDIVDWHRNNQEGKNMFDAANDSPENNDSDDGLLSWLSWFCAQDDL